MLKLAHIINPVSADTTSDLYVAQPITFETIRRAKQYANGVVDVELYSAQYIEDRHIAPSYFIPTPDLVHSILDFGNFREKRKLPLFKDILNNLYEATDADYLIYTNVDIALQPYFYVTVNAIINENYDAFTINKRIISDKYKFIDEIPLMLAERGGIHGGHDCFVFKREVYPKYVLGNVCLGIGGVGSTLLLNLVCHANCFALFSDKHLTFHIGDEHLWRDVSYSDMLAFNKKERRKAIGKLENKHGKIDRSIITRSNVRRRKKASLLHRLLSGEKHILRDG